MNDIARGEWLFNGYITSDCGAVSNIPQTHHYTNSSAATFGVTLPAGMDVGCDLLLVQPGTAAAALASGAVTGAQIDTALLHLLAVRFRLGEFDPAADQPYMRIGVEAVCSQEHTALAQDSARQSLVLLANPKGALPLSRAAVSSVAVLGFGNSSKLINGGPNYAGIPCGGAAVTVVQALQLAGLAVSAVPGCDSIACPTTAGFPPATAAAAAADATIVVVGLDETIEDEALDRTYITLPGHQEDLILAACAASKGPCTVLLMSGGGVDLTASLASPSVAAIVYAGFMGGSGAPAFVDTLFGASAPAGRLTQTFYPADFVTQVSMEDMNMPPGPSAFPPGSSPGRTYKYYTGTPVWQFGAGLSYTTWDVSVSGPGQLPLAPVQAYLAPHSHFHGALYASRRQEPVMGQYNVTVRNTGAVDSDYVVLGFLTPPGAGTQGIPLKKLFGFDRVRVAAGQSVQVFLGVGARELTHASKGARVPLTGLWKVTVGVEGEPHLAQMDVVVS